MKKKLTKKEIGIKMEAVEAFKRYLKAGKPGTLPVTAKVTKSILIHLAHIDTR